ncbi:serine/threonine-protein kinase pim-3-like [Triplophysa dalaica]|uniref:serine/threonine-protein kinase pim-3-like n=1 Tax=Triplophysa dalaica TaxID=1582913 RepID=UPI0024DFF6AD|nr:serine/threonine-protein kinase pim-3-like [Triplophysa dalaica]
MLDWFVEDGTHILIMEYPHPCETLANFLESHKGRLKETEARHLLRQAVNAAKHSIDHNLTHGDLHRENVLINTRTMELKLIDFGFSSLIPDTPCEGVAEMVLSMGSLVFMMTTGYEAFNRRDQDLLHNPRIKALGLSKGKSSRSSEHEQKMPYHPWSGAVSWAH